MLFFYNNNNNNKIFVSFRRKKKRINCHYSILLASYIENNQPKELILPVNLKHKNDSIPIDCRQLNILFISSYIFHLYSSSDTNEKSTLDDDDNSPTIATTLATLPINNSIK